MPPSNVDDCSNNRSLPDGARYPHRTDMHCAPISLRNRRRNPLPDYFVNCSHLTKTIATALPAITRLP